MEYFEYNGKSYPFKSVYFQNDNSEYNISTEDLSYELFPNGSDYDSDEARDIDEKIFFFVPERILNNSDAFIEKYISEAI